jgi:CubicO group peptidase (beta-lactamase class C family)
VAQVEEIEMLRCRRSHQVLGITGMLVALSLTATAGQPSGAPMLDRADLEAWLDGYLPSALHINDMAGAIVVVVKDGQVLLQKGYGYDDVAAKRAVDPERTVFPVASVSKTFTATAVMQLVEQGKLDLDRDVNEYLDFKIPPAWGKPITLRNLLTHTPGFDDLQKGSSPAANDPKWYLSLEAYMKRRSPNRILPPGEIPAYSNYGFGLAAYIVQRISGEPFEEYLKHHIFEPLGMRRSSAYQPTPPDLMPDIAKAYIVASGEPKTAEFTNTRGAGGVVATGADMARYMIAHLHDGRYGDVQILQPQTARLMHSRIFSAVPHINGMAIAFFQQDYNGQRIIGHDGDTKAMHSNVQLLLDQDVGFFVDFNSDGNNGAVYDIRDSIVRDFLDRYYPAPVPQEPTVATAKEHAQLVAGSYESSRRLNGVLRVFMMFNTIAVAANPDGTISIPMPPTGELQTYHEIGPFLWREVGGKKLLEARAKDGRVVSLHLGAVDTLIKIPAWKSSSFNVPVLAAAILAMLATLLHWPIAALVRRHYGRRLTLTGVGARTHWLVRLGTLTMLLFIFGWVFLTMNLLSHFYMFNAGIDPWIRLLHFIGLLGVAGAGIAVWNAWIVWRSPHNIWVKIWNIVLAALLLWLVWFTFTFNLITASLDY